MKRATIAIQYDDVNCYLLAIDLESGEELFRREFYAYDDDFNEDREIKKLCDEFKIDEVHLINW